MTRESNYQGYMKHGDVLTIPFYTFSSVALFIERLDATDATGFIQVRNVMPKSYTYDSHILYLDAPTASYGFPLNNQVSRVPLSPFTFNLSTLAAPVETLSGRALTLSGGNLINGNYSAARLTGHYAMVPPTVQVQDTFTGITAQDASGFGWSIEGWVFRNSATLSTYYIEANAGVTSYLQMFIDAAGHMNISHSGTIAFTGTKVITAGAWHHIALVYNGTTITEYLDGVASAGVAHTHGAYSGISLNRLNHGASNVHFTQSLACYNTALVADDIARHYREITDAGGTAGDFFPAVIYQSPSAIGIYSGATIIFSNDITPNEQHSNVNMSPFMVLPLIGVGQIIVSSSVTTDRWFYALRLVENETVQ